MQVRIGIVLASLVLIACGRSRVVSPLPPTDGGPVDGSTPDGSVPDGGRLDAGRDAGRDAGAEGFRYAILRSDCGPADGFAWRGVVAREPLDCDDFGRTDEHVSLYLFDGDRLGTYAWSGDDFDDFVAYCPGGRAACISSTEGEAQVSLRPGASPTLRLRVVLPDRGTIVDGELEATVCFEDEPTPCG
jgi:hypothetical protein